MVKTIENKAELVQDLLLGESLQQYGYLNIYKGLYGDENKYHGSLSIMFSDETAFLSVSLTYKKKYSEKYLYDQLRKIERKYL